MYDLIIIGSGPAGLTAGIYASRARLSTLVLEQNFVSGGQIIDTYEIDNYPGLPGISGMDLADKMSQHAEKLGVAIENVIVTSLDLTGPVKKVITDDNTYEAKAVIDGSTSKATRQWSSRMSNGRYAMTIVSRIIRRL